MVCVSSENGQAGVRCLPLQWAGGPAPAPCWGWPVAKAVTVPSMTRMVCLAVQCRRACGQAEHTPYDSKSML